MEEKSSLRDWPVRPEVRKRELLPTPKKRRQLTAGGPRVSRRKFFGLGAKAGIAAAAVGMFGRGAYETGVDVKKGFETTVRAFKSLPRFFYNEPGAVEPRVESIKAETEKPQTEFQLVFHDLEPEQLGKAVNLVRAMHGVLGQNPEYQAGTLYDVTKKHESLIRGEAAKKGFNPDLSVGIVFVENGGGEKIINQNSGAAGVAQLMPETGRRYGLRVDNQIDERLDPKKAIPAMINYLSDLKKEFLDEGLAVWGYHAGEGNVYSALRAYFKNVDRTDYGDVIQSLDPTAAQKYRQLIAERKVSIHQVLQNPGVQQEVLVNLYDETELYVYKVIAGTQLFRINKETFG